MHSRFKFFSLTFFLLMLLPSSVLQAQTNDVQVFDFCNFGGDAARVKPGEHRNMGSINFRNDRISSIKVPAGIEVQIFEDDDFKGDFATITGDIRCFDQFWDDRVSSIKVIDNRPRAQSPRLSTAQTPNPSVLENPITPIDLKVNAANVAKVVFGRSVLQQTSKSQWRLDDPRKGKSVFKEVARESNSVLLVNQNTAERVRIDFFARDVTFVNPNGSSQRFAITQALAGVSNSSAPALNRNQNALARSTPKSTPKVYRLAKPCFNYRAYTKGGVGGVRVFGSLEFVQFTKKPITGRVCINKEDTLELQKNNRNTDVFFEIDGDVFRFAPNEAHDVFKNTWYRRKTQLLVSG